MTDFVSTNPATGEIIARYPVIDADTLDATLDRAVAAARAWGATPIERRAEVLHAAAGVLRARAEDLARTITAEMGKPIVQARGEVEKCAGLCEWYAANGTGFLSDEALPVGDDGAATLCWQPIGVVLAVMPWNFPLWQALRAAVPILLAGNGYVLKHSDNVQGCAEALVEALCAAGLPDGVFVNVALAQDAIVPLIADRRIAAVTVTAGVAAGAAIAAEAGRNIKKSVLELGGIDPFVVLADCDLEAAVSAAVRSRFLNGGQVCIAAKRLIVEASILDAFTGRFVAAVRALVVGDPMDEATFVGPMARLRGRDELHRHVEDSVAAGATLLLGGAPVEGAGAYYRPTVLGGVTRDMAAACNELFGPVAAIMAADDAEHAIALANDSDYGLSAALWCGDPARAQALARRIEAGAVFVNGISASDPRVPIGGVKKSGYGRELSWFGVREFTNAKLIWAR